MKDEAAEDGSVAASRRGSVEVVLYGKPGCHLCADALAVVEAVRAERGFALEQVDISLDPVLFRRYGERIPVVAVAGEEAFEYVVEANALRERLDRVTA